MQAKRQNIQLELALEPEAKGEARRPGPQGTEVCVARVGPEHPAAGRGPSIEAVVEPGNLRKALARVRRNKGAPGLDGMPSGSWATKGRADQTRRRKSLAAQLRERAHTSMPSREPWSLVLPSIVANASGHASATMPTWVQSDGPSR